MLQRERDSMVKGNKKKKKRKTDQGKNISLRKKKQMKKKTNKLWRWSNSHSCLSERFLNLLEM